MSTDQEAHHGIDRAGMVADIRQIRNRIIEKRLTFTVPEYDKALNLFDSCLDFELDMEEYTGEWVL